MSLRAKSLASAALRQAFLQGRQPSLPDGEKARARVEGWILGVAGTLDEPLSRPFDKGGERRGTLH